MSHPTSQAPPASTGYLSLDAARIRTTVATLGRRIRERFPGSGLANLAVELERLIDKADRASEELARPIYALRAVSALLALLIFAVLAVAIVGLRGPDEPLSVTAFVQVLEAAINDMVFVAIGVFFLTSIERRFKRRKALRALHELRSIAHIVDMHQLTKDPAHVLHRIVDTPSSPQRTLDRGDLARYLDYCSETLSLTGKIAALYAQRFDDGVVLASVNEVEDLTTGLSRKIWQKLMILEMDRSARPPENAV